MTTLSAMETPQKKPPPQYLWARWVSDVVSPPVVWIVMSLVVAVLFSDTLMDALYWAAIYSLFVCLLPVFFIMYQVYMGEIGDIHMKYRHERYKPLLVTILSNIVGWALLHWLEAPIVIELLAIMSLIEVSIISIITLYWQISMHAMAITGATMAIGIVLSPTIAVLMIPLIMLVGAARIRLDRHTPMQIFAGAMVGAFAPVILFLFMTPLLYFIL